MLFNGSARSTSETQFYRNPKSGQASFVDGDMDIDTFLRDFVEAKVCLMKKKRQELAIKHGN